jgi:hypothetical protein
MEHPAACVVSRSRGAKEQSSRAAEGQRGRGAEEQGEQESVGCSTVAGAAGAEQTQGRAG